MNSLNTVSLKTVFFLTLRNIHNYRLQKISSVLEDRKSFSVGGGEENRSKNRSELVIPYDRNRVILTPVPGREHSTYINASFIEGYDNSESFVITQDPLETTVTDFWRMISEQCISTIVMLSDVSLYYMLYFSLHFL